MEYIRSTGEVHYTLDPDDLGVERASRARTAKPARKIPGISTRWCEHFHWIWFLLYSGVRHFVLIGSCRSRLLSSNAALECSPGYNRLAGPGGAREIGRAHV